MIVMVPLLLTLVQYLCGSIILQCFLPVVHSRIYKLVTSFIIGIVFTVPFLYLFEVIVGVNIYKTTVALIIVGIGLCLVKYRFLKGKFPKAEKYKDTILDYIVFIFSLMFSSYIMTKTFKIGIDGALFVGSNEVFDFGHNLSIIRSFSWGDNIPYLSPFVSGVVDIYHFFFYYWIGFLERFGLPIDFAVNIPSIVAFTFLLVTIYYFPIIVTGSRRIVGVLALLFVITHSTLTWLFFIQSSGFSLDSISSLWRQSTYLFAGPYDGSAISIYHTLNVFVNQRHLALLLACCFVLYEYVVLSLKNKTRIRSTSIIVGISLGLMPLWHLMLTIGAGVILLVLYAMHKRWREVLTVIILSIIGILIGLLPWVFQLSYSSFSTDFSAMNSFRFVSQYSLLYKVIVNYGIALILVPIGLFSLSWNNRKFYIPFIFLIIVSYGLSYFFASEIDQKFLNIFLIIVAIISAYAITYLFKKGVIGKIVSIACIFIYLVSGMIDLMVIKNDYMYKIPNTGSNELIYWIKNNTSNNAVFLSYADIFDSVTLAGRTNYWGFYRNFGQPNREQEVQELYGQTAIDNPNLFKNSKIRYVVFPLHHKDRFLYSSSLPLFKEKFPIIYKSDEILIFDVDLGT